MSWRPKPLHRSMKVLGALFLTLSAATPASSVFIIVPDVLAEAGTGALIAMGLAAVIALCISQVYAELGSAFPLAGGEYAIVARTLGPLAGFAVLGVNLFNSVLTAAVLALGLAQYVLPGDPGLAVPIALAAVGGSTLLALLNIRTNAVVTGLFVGVELLALTVLFVLGVLHPARNLGAVLAHPVMASGASLAPVGPAAIGLAVAVAVFAYDGYGSALYFGEEMHEAPSRIGRAITWAVLITVAAEILPLGAVIGGAPKLGPLLRSTFAFGDFIRWTGGGVLERVVMAGVALAIFNAVIATILLTSRQLYGTGGDRTWPGGLNQAMAALHPKFHSPWLAALVAGLLASALCFLDLKLLLIATGTGVTVIYGFICVAVLVGRRSKRTAHGRYRLPFFPLVPIFALAALAGVIWSDWVDPAEGRPGLFITLGVIGASCLYYLVAIRPWRRWPASVEAALAPE